MNSRTIHTTRLILRQWKQEDKAAFAALNANPEVMAHFPAVLTTQESDTLAQRLMSDIEQRGWGLWAVEHKELGKFMGFTGLQVCKPPLPFAPAIEIGWRLSRQFWGCGYATEAARACLEFSFAVLAEQELISFTAVTNLRSQSVMQKLRMTRRSTFDHPLLPQGHPLQPHVLFAITQHQYKVSPRAASQGVRI